MADKEKKPERKGEWIAHIDCQKCPYPAWKAQGRCGECATLSKDERTGEKFVALRPVV